MTMCLSRRHTRRVWTRATSRVLAMTPYRPSLMHYQNSQPMYALRCCVRSATRYEIRLGVGQQQTHQMNLQTALVGKSARSECVTAGRACARMPATHATRRGLAVAPPLHPAVQVMLGGACR